MTLWRMSVNCVAGMTWMISIDTNVIISALNSRDVNNELAVAALSDLNRQRVLRISPVVLSELMASSTNASVRNFLESTAIHVHWEVPPLVWERAGLAFGEYARNRRQGSLPRRLAADFLIAAQAEHFGMTVLTFDRTVYEAVFPGVSVLP